MSTRLSLLGCAWGWAWRVILRRGEWGGRFFEGSTRRRDALVAPASSRRIYVSVGAGKSRQDGGATRAARRMADAAARGDRREVLRLRPRARKNRGKTKIARTPLRMTARNQAKGRSKVETTATPFV